MLNSNITKYPRTIYGELSYVIPDSYITFEHRNNEIHGFCVHKNNHEETTFYSSKYYDVFVLNLNKVIVSRKD